MMPLRPARRMVAAATLIAAGGIGLAGCGDDDTNVDVPATVASATTTPTSATSPETVPNGTAMSTVPDDPGMVDQPDDTGAGTAP